jgi:phosphoribosylformimino-5-aminoimidazole carboxamide ribotide isomerase
MRMDVIPAIDVAQGRSRVVYWPGASAGIGTPTDRPERIAEQFVAHGARIAGDWLAVGLDPRPERLAAFPWRRAAPPTLDALVEELIAQGVRRLVLSHGGASPDPGLLASLVNRHDADILVAGGVTDLEGVRRMRDAGVTGLILGEALLSGSIDFPRALEAAA